MKANELRIGNWVKDSRENYPCKVLAIDSEHSFTAKGGEVYVGIATCSQKDMPCGSRGIWLNFLEPIPLTEELLLKCGAILFESTYDGWHFYHLKHFVFDGRKGKVYFGAFDRDCEGHNNDFEIEIEYLHQLQNLYFALTGEELDIELL